MIGAFFEQYRIALIALALALVFAAGWEVRGWKADSDDALRLEAKQNSEELARAVIAGVAKNTAVAVAGIKVTNTTIYQKTRHEIIKEPMDPDCRLPAGWMRRINDGRSGVDRSEPAAAVP